MQVMWPGALSPSVISWVLEGTSRSGGASLTGSEQVVSSGAGRWKASLAVMPAGQSDAEHEGAVLALRAFLAQMEGRVGEVLLPVFDGFRPHDDNGRMFAEQDQASLEDLFMFEHWGFGQDVETHATLAASAASRATQISIDVQEGQGPRPGNYFGIGERLYIAQQVWQDEPAGATFIRCSPPLRSSVSSGARVILDRPVCRMRLASDNTGELAMEMARWGRATIEFVEAV